MNSIYIFLRKSFFFKLVFQILSYIRASGLADRFFHNTGDQIDCFLIAYGDSDDQRKVSSQSLLFQKMGRQDIKEIFSVGGQRHQIDIQHSSAAFQLPDDLRLFFRGLGAYIKLSIPFHRIFLSTLRSCLLLWIISINSNHYSLF